MTGSIPVIDAWPPPFGSAPSGRRKMARALAGDATLDGSIQGLRAGPKAIFMKTSRIFCVLIATRGGDGLRSGQSAAIDSGSDR